MKYLGTFHVLLHRGLSAHARSSGTVPSRVHCSVGSHEDPAARAAEQKQPLAGTPLQQPSRGRALGSQITCLPAEAQQAALRCQGCSCLQQMHRVSVRTCLCRGRRWCLLASSPGLLGSALSRARAWPGAGCSWSGGSAGAARSLPQMCIFCSQMVRGWHES